MTIALVASIAMGSLDAEESPASGRASSRAQTTPDRPKVFVESFRGPIGITTKNLVRDSIRRCHVFEVANSEGPDTFTIGATAIGGKIDAVIFQPGGSVLMKRLYESPNLRQNAHRLVDDLTEIVTQQPGIASTTIGFVSDQSGVRQVYLCDSDGHDIRPITANKAIEASEPCLPISHGKIFFTGSKNGYPDIYSINLTGEDASPTRIINAPGNNRFPSLSRDGSRLAVSMSYSGTPDLYVTSAVGGQGRRLTNDAFSESHPAWSPDGKHIAFSRSEPSGNAAQLVIATALGGDQEVVADLQETPARPEWSPDGRFIAFSINSDEKQGIALFDANEKESRVLKNTKSAVSPTWAPDSRHLAFVFNDALWVYELATGHREKIVSDFGKISEATWSQ